MIDEERWVRASVLVVLFSLWWTGGVIFCPEHSIFLWVFVAGYEFSILEVDCNVTMLIPVLYHFVSDRVLENRQENVQVFFPFCLLTEVFSVCSPPGFRSTSRFQRLC